MKYKRNISYFISYCISLLHYIIRTIIIEMLFYDILQCMVAAGTESVYIFQNKIQIKYFKSKHFQVKRNLKC